MQQTTADSGSTIRDQYYTKDELARELGRSTRTIDRWHTRRVGPPRHKVAGKLVLYRKIW